MFPEWMGNGWALVWFTSIALTVSHIVSYFLKDKFVRFWLAYVALFLGGAALLTSFHSARSAVNVAKMEFASGRLDRAGTEVLREIASTQNHMCNFRGIRSSMSPPDFDEIEKLREKICGMFTRIKLYADNVWDKEHERFGPPEVGLKTVKDPVWKQSVERLQQVEEEHRNALNEVLDLQPEPWLFWTALEPFVISASWSLGLALMVPARKRRRRLCRHEHQ